VFERSGGPEVLEAKEVPDPSPADGQVVVEVEAVGVNYRDVYEREGNGYGSEPPAIIGVEGAGRIAGTGERVGWVGVPGSYAERVAASRDGLIPLPEGVPAEQAAAVLLQGMTATTWPPTPIPSTPATGCSSTPPPAVWVSCSPSWPSSAAAG